MRNVTAFEASLLHLLYFFLKRAPVQQALPLLEGAPVRPRCLTRPAVELVEDTLAKGCVLLLTRAGGWRKERHLRNGRVVEGRLWERTPPEQLGLRFTAQSLSYLVWVTGIKLSEANGEPWKPAPRLDYGTGDHLLFYFAHEALSSTDYAVSLAGRPPFVDHPLCWLAYPENFSRVTNVPSLDYGPWMEGVGGSMVEALQPVLAERWVQVEADKSKIRDPAVMRNLGAAQERALNGFLGAVEQAGRYDLARFLLQAAARLLTPHANAAMWVGQLRTTGLRLADRAETHRLALILLRQLGRLQRWEQEARTVGYFDEGYVASQLWKGIWEQYQGDTLAARAHAIIQQMDPMRQNEERS